MNLGKTGGVVSTFQGHDMGRWDYVEKSELQLLKIQDWRAEEVGKSFEYEYLKFESSFNGSLPVSKSSNWWNGCQIWQKCFTYNY